MEFTSMEDARIWFMNSSLAEQEWYEDFDHDELIEYIWHNADGNKSGEVLVAEYLRDHGHNPAVYGL